MSVSIDFIPQIYYNLPGTKKDKRKGQTDVKVNTIPMNDNMRELTQHGSVGFPIQYYVDEIFRFPNHSVPLHWHPELEFFVVRGGDVYIQIGKQVFQAEEGTGIFINANVLHGFWQKDENARCQCPNIVFSEELIASVGSRIYQEYIRPITMDGQMPYVLLKPDNLWEKEILQCLDRIFSLLQKYGDCGIFGKTPVLAFENGEIASPCYEMAVQSELNLVWQKLFSHKSEVPRVSFAKNEHLLQIRTQKMLCFIQNNYDKPISLPEIALAADVSKSEASRCFQAYLHTSPVRYLLWYRIEKAKQELMKNPGTIEQISRECGFQSFSYFCKMFRIQTGMTAKEYRHGKY